MTDEVVEKLQNMLTLEWMISNHSRTERSLKPSFDIIWSKSLLIIFYEGYDHSFTLPTSATKLDDTWWREKLTDSMKDKFEEFIRVMEL